MMQQILLTYDLLATVRTRMYHLLAVGVSVAGWLDATRRLVTPVDWLRARLNCHPIVHRSHVYQITITSITVLDEE